ncbi:hypothetical protein TCT1_04580 [Xenorhabdus sp. TCT-1]|uniref:Transposase n=1 Tax=Xenorhabdus taiwanensis TaxID=3085177 RepID=A0ABN7BYY7_9GAMM|nr:hypothetical protein TCT1_04580 [Xenorhabdus sp. TCT-1]
MTRPTIDLTSSRSLDEKSKCSGELRCSPIFVTAYLGSEQFEVEYLDSVLLKSVCFDSVFLDPK